MGTHPSDMLLLLPKVWPAKISSVQMGIPLEQAGV